MNKKKVVHIVPMFGAGGVQTAMLYSMNDLNKVYDYKILVITDVQEDFIEHLPAHQKNCIIRLGASNHISGWIKGYRLIKRMQPDVIICSLWKSIILSVLYKFFNNKIILFSFFHTSYSPHLVYIVLHKILLAFQDACMVDSIVTKDYVSKFYGSNKIYTIPFIFPFTLKKYSRTFDPSAVRFVYFGNLLKVKNVDRSLAFCNICKMRGLNFIFDLYTFGAVEEYRIKIAKLGLNEHVSIKNIVPLNVVQEKMSEYDFLLQLSNKEGMALAVVEAMSCGLVPIVTPVGEIGRYSKDGVNAIWLDLEFDKNLPNLFDKLKNVVEKPELYNKLSTSAKNAFVNYKGYSESMIEAINMELSKKNINIDN